MWDALRSIFFGTSAEPVTDCPYLRLVESYLLNELTEEQMQSFELHYWTCAQCLESMKAATTFVQGLKDGAGEPD